MRIGSVCSGVDGLALGLEWAGVGHTVWHAEVDADACKVLAERWPGVPNHGDLKEACWERAESIDILVGGYPCQPFSVAGDRRGAADERHLWPHVLNALRVLRPPLALFENVAGHVSLGLDIVLADLAAVGFDAQWGLVRASDVGAPHRRERVFILAADATRPHGGGWRSRQQVGGTGGSGWPDAGDGDRSTPAHSDGQPIRDHQGRVGAEASSPQGERHERQRLRADDVDGGTGSSAHAHDAGRCEQRRPESARTQDASAERGSTAAADPDGGRCERQREPQPSGQQGAPGRVADGPGADGWLDDATSAAVDWSIYRPAIERWERITGRSTPAPVDERERLSPMFVEWMQGFPAGFVTDVIGRRPALRVLGNTVVPQVAALVGQQI